MICATDKRRTETWNGWNGSHVGCVFRLGNLSPVR